MGFKGGFVWRVVMTETSGLVVSDRVSSDDEDSLIVVLEPSTIDAGASVLVLVMLVLVESELCNGGAIVVDGELGVFLASSAVMLTGGANVAGIGSSMAMLSLETLCTGAAHSYLMGQHDLSSPGS